MFICVISFPCCIDRQGITLKLVFWCLKVTNSSEFAKTYHCLLVRKQNAGQKCLFFPCSQKNCFVCLFAEYIMQKKEKSWTPVVFFFFVYVLLLELQVDCPVAILVWKSGSLLEPTEQKSTQEYRRGKCCLIAFKPYTSNSSVLRSDIRKTLQD